MVRKGPSTGPVIWHQWRTPAMASGTETLITSHHKELSYHDAKVCRYYMVRFCPHDLFRNTKADLGPCHKLHDKVVRQKYLNEASSYTKTEFEGEFLKYCQSILNEVERKTQMGEQRLAESQLAKQTAAANPETKAEDPISVVTEKITHLVKEVERLGWEGKEAQELLIVGDQLKREKQVLKKEKRLSVDNQQMLKKQLCKVCGVFVMVSDSPSGWVDYHMQGKQHVGYEKLWSAVNEITEYHDKSRQDREMQRQKETKDRHGRRHDDDSRRHRERSGRSRSRSPKQRSSNSGDRHRDKDRSSSKDRRGRKRDERP